MVIPTVAYWIESFAQPNIEQPLKQLYERYYPYIVGQIVQQGGSQEDASDIFQEAVLIFIDKVRKDQFRGESSVQTFLSAIARNIWLTEIRTRDRRRKREHVYQDQFEVIEYNPSPMTGLTGESLESTMNLLGEACRKLLIGFYYEKKSMRSYYWSLITKPSKC